MEEKIIIKLKDKELIEKVKLIRKAKINITELICGWILEYEINVK